MVLQQRSIQFQVSTPNNNASAPLSASPSSLSILSLTTNQSKKKRRRFLSSFSSSFQLTVVCVAFAIMGLSSWRYHNFGGIATTTNTLEIFSATNPERDAQRLHYLLRLQKHQQRQQRQQKGEENILQEQQHSRSQQQRQQNRPLVKGQSFVISFTAKNYEQFLERNYYNVPTTTATTTTSSSRENLTTSNNLTIKWHHAVDGSSSQVQKSWRLRLKMKTNQEQRLEKEDTENGEFETIKETDPKGPTGPHALGCYLSHYNLLKDLDEKGMGIRTTKEEELGGDAKTNDVTYANSPTKNASHHRHSQNDNDLLDDYFIIFEDDAMCVSSIHLQEQVETVVGQLPTDWDLLYIGGKPFSRIDVGRLGWVGVGPGTTEKNSNSNSTILSLKDYIMDARTSRDKDMQLFCNTTVPTPSAKDVHEPITTTRIWDLFDGPLPPNTPRPATTTAQGTTFTSSRNDRRRDLSIHDPYWRVDYHTNTEAYVVNPRSLPKILKVLSEVQKSRPPKGQLISVPIDMILATAMAHRQLNVFMTTRALCVQPKMGHTREDLRSSPAGVGWKGFYWEYSTNPDIVVNEPLIWNDILACPTTLVKYLMRIESN
eukprot:CAMPEP_0113466978 /NCGR_PEP_ID=MMETSP0014_2-20120614/14568_1 /TAXON_ID=2857 /ORGANISM="Nitzschia sp." /LENGTH=598 /DNA_ID=CAMNT_0000359253 /DNA_START=145 /DNA_END=1938 /DNA_ORIENTATION=+ /assembly_acc=CAM_ASM_000159